MIVGQITNVTSATWQGRQYAVISVRANLLTQPECTARPADIDQVKELLTQARICEGGLRTSNGQDPSSTAHPHQNARAFDLTIRSADRVEAAFVAEKYDFTETSGGYALYDFFLVAAENDLRSFIGKDVALRPHDQVVVEPFRGP
jgi:hypothetical protein